MYTFSTAGVNGFFLDRCLQLRVTSKRKSAYVKAARPGKLAPWIFAHLDKAAGYKPKEKAP